MTLEQLALEQHKAIHGRNPSGQKAADASARLNKWAKNTYGVVPNGTISLASETQKEYSAYVNGVKK
jgi:hypothetical protein